MKYNKAMLWMMVCSAFIIGCGKDEPTDNEQLDSQVKQNGWYTSIDQTPRNDIPGTSKGDTSIPRDMWRIMGEGEINYDIIVEKPNARIPLEFKWPDTLMVVYTDIPDTSIRDTIAKPAPYFNGTLTYYYRHEDGQWVFDKITPIAVKSDSAHPYVKLDSIQVEVLGQGMLPTIKDCTTPIPIENYPYTFNVGDTVRIKVFESGTAPSNWVFLHAPVFDNVSEFDYDTVGGYWFGKWVTKAVGKHWAWVDLWDLDVIFEKDVTTERDELWGLPYIVE